MLISIVAIALNEAEHIPFWYEQHKNLADEFILVDTGSYDNTEQVARQYPIKYTKIEWRHHFADMKNAAMRFAKGDWIFLQSPDFWMHENNFEKLKNELRNAGNTKGFAIPSQAVREFGRTDLGKAAETLQLEKQVAPERIIAETHVCIFKNDADIYYRHRVHENINERIIQLYGREAIKILPYVRYHHSPAILDSNVKKKEYYDFLEGIVEVERDLYGRAEVLRKQAYDYEL